MNPELGAHDRHIAFLAVEASVVERRNHHTLAEPTQVATLDGGTGVLGEFGREIGERCAFLNGVLEAVGSSTGFGRIAIVGFDQNVACLHGVRDELIAHDARYLQGIELFVGPDDRAGGGGKGDCINGRLERAFGMVGGIKGRIAVLVHEHRNIRSNGQFFFLLGDPFHGSLAIFA